MSGCYGFAVREDQSGVQPLHIINWSKAFETLIDREIGLEIRLCIPCGDGIDTEPAWWSVGKLYVDGELRVVGARSIERASTFKLRSREGRVQVHTVVSLPF